MAGHNESVATILAGPKRKKGHEDAEGLNAAYEEFAEAVKAGDKSKGMEALRSFVQMARDDD